ncbi:hypothetical protein AB0C34_30690 [Nocardia sp. NPDC049220]|uniref:hypothetical protein n=1 Tax=Nocardia sp. NPDC049220 TaxID=3155273 RepID=UPI0033CA2F99
MADDRMAEVFAAVRLGGVDQIAARQVLEKLWHETGDHADALHRCLIAHYLADLQAEAADALRWDQCALAAVFGAGIPLDEGLRGFLPSLYLNLADSHRRVGEFEVARMQLAIARGHLDVLAADAYGALIRSRLRSIEAALLACSLSPLANS